MPKRLQKPDRFEHPIVMELKKPPRQNPSKIGQQKKQKQTHGLLGRNLWVALDDRGQEQEILHEGGEVVAGMLPRDGQFIRAGWQHLPQTQHVVAPETKQEPEEKPTTFEEKPGLPVPPVHAAIVPGMQYYTQSQPTNNFNPKECTLKLGGVGGSCGMQQVYLFPYKGIKGLGEEDRKMLTGGVATLVLLNSRQAHDFGHELEELGYRIIMKDFYNPVHNTLLTLYVYEPYPERSPAHPKWDKEKYPIQGNPKNGVALYVYADGRGVY